jgi:hypothetical protein
LTGADEEGTHRRVMALPTKPPEVLAPWIDALREAGLEA